MHIPYLSSYQVLENSQGTLDPLGMYSIADRLATRLAPGLRERMRRPRYLTIMAVGASICAGFDEDLLAADGISDPTQVFEWYVVSAFIRHFERTDSKDQLLSMPGRSKASAALKENILLSASTYLKTPSVFGFHGVYRTLAKEIGLFDGNGPGDFGLRLIDVWENENKDELDGFRTCLRGTPGAEFHSRLLDGVQRGLDKGAVAYAWSWSTLEKLARMLAPGRPGKEEARLLLEQLSKDDSGARGLLFDFLNSEDSEGINGDHEKEFHQRLLPHAGRHRPLLEAIMAYEHSARLLYNAFYSVLRYLGNNRMQGRLADMAKLPEVALAAREFGDSCDRTEELLSPFDSELLSFIIQFQDLRERCNPAEWLRLLLEHHNRVQKNKPPTGKAPWLLECGSDKYLLCATQELDAELSNEYVHQYRTTTVINFLNDLNPE
jgi:hypothetical protein